MPASLDPLDRPGARLVETIAMLTAFALFAVATCEGAYLLAVRERLQSGVEAAAELAMGGRASHDAMRAEIRRNTSWLMSLADDEIAIDDTRLVIGNSASPALRIRVTRTHHPLVAVVGGVTFALPLKVELTAPAMAGATR
jgi:hypothetical protein